MCSTTLWVGHLSKLVQQEELSDTFGEFGDIVSIDVIPPRGCAFICMNRRQDAARALTRLKDHKLHGKNIMVRYQHKINIKHAYSHINFDCMTFSWPGHLEKELKEETTKIIGKSILAYRISRGID